MACNLRDTWLDEDYAFMPLVRVLHDYFSIVGGGERLALTLAHGLDAELVCGRWDQGSFARSEHSALQITDLGLPDYPAGLRTLMLARAFAQSGARLKPADAHIYSGVCAPLAAAHDHCRRRIFYCHTPPRFLFDQRDFYRQSLPALLRPLLDALNAWLEPRYRHAVAQMDCVVANSQHVRARIAEHLGVAATVIYPPCELERFGFASSSNFFFSNARLDPLKRVDRIVAAFLQMPKQNLVVASSGPEAKRLQALAVDAPNVRFVGRLSDAEMAQYLAECRALIYIPVDEDFGISPVEAMASGKPVIAARAGGLLESLIEGETGVFIAADAPLEQLIEAVGRLDGVSAERMRAACEARALAFGRERFIAEIKAVLA